MASLNRKSKKIIYEVSSNFTLYVQIRPTKTADSIVPYEVNIFLRDGSSKTVSLIHTKILQLKIPIFFFKMRM